MTKTMTVLAVRKLPQGGFVVYEPTYDRGLASIDLFATGDMDEALEFIGENLGVAKNE
jgi:hypothetical protein